MTKGPWWHAEPTTTQSGRRANEPGSTEPARRDARNEPSRGSQPARTHLDSTIVECERRERTRLDRAGKARCAKRTQPWQSAGANEPGLDDRQMRTARTNVMPHGSIPPHENGGMCAWHAVRGPILRGTSTQRPVRASFPCSATSISGDGLTIVGYAGRETRAQPDATTFPT